MLDYKDESHNWIRMSKSLRLCVCGMCICMQMYVVHLLVYVRVKARGRLEVSSTAFHLSFLRQGFSVNLDFTISVILAG